jgi:hypothetical protein
MDPNALREATQAMAFRPFRVHLADGRSFLIPHPEFLWVPPPGRRVYLAQPDNDRVIIVEPLLIVTLEPADPTPTAPDNPTTNGTGS